MQAEHKDRIQRTIKVGDTCFTSGGKSRYQGFAKGTVTKLGPKMVTVTRSGTEDRGFFYGRDVLVVDDLLNPPEQILRDKIRHCLLEDGGGGMTVEEVLLGMTKKLCDFVGVDYETGTTKNV